MKKRILKSALAILMVGLAANVFAANLTTDYIGSNGEWFTEDSQKPFEVSIFPNPNNGKFEILTNGIADEVKEVVIYNIIGEQVYYQKFGELTLNVDLTNLDKGLYMMQIYNSDRKEKLTKRFYIE